MAKNKFLDKEWNKNHLRKIKHRAGNRYTPKLNIELPISKKFEGLCKTKEFIHDFRRMKGELSSSFSRVSNNYSNPKIKKSYSKLNKKVKELLSLLDNVKAYSSEDIPYKKINKLSEKSTSLLWELTDSMREEKRKLKESSSHKNIAHTVKNSSNNFDTDIHYLQETYSKISYFKDLSTSTTGKLSNIPFYLITGVAGNGKTHLLCDITESRHKANLPSVLVFGELFETNEDPFTQIIKQLGLSQNKNQFLRSLNQAGKKSQTRSILAIDALNETRNRQYWKKNLKTIISEVKKYPHIALVVSIRTGFEKETLVTNLRKKFIEDIHQGFKFREWEAVSKFFDEFNLPAPEIPVLMSEFQNPLFLLLFCKAFQKSKKRRRKGKQVFRGHEGATYIFESFVDRVSKDIAKKFKISNAPKKNIWDTVIENIAKELVETNDDRLSENKLHQIIKNNHPHVNTKSFTKELERNLLIVKLPSYSFAKNDYDGFEYRFPFQKFSDHLIGRYIFKKYESEFGIKNKNLKTAKRFFSRRRKLGKFLDKYWNQGIVEALCIQCPEHLQGIEFIQVAPYLEDKQFLQDAFIESIIWRKPTAFSKDLKNTFKFINQVIIRTKNGHHNFLNAVISVAPIPSHPFNADFLHKHLTKFSMPNRDSWWSVFLHYYYGEQNSSDRLVEWAWSNSDKKYLKDDSIRLSAICLTWFLSSSNRFLRDKTTKALTALLTNKLNVVLSLVDEFKNVNDPYILERLYAVSYGVSVKSIDDKQGLRKLADWFYKNNFKNKKPPVNILTRCYARNLIELAIDRKINIKVNRNLIEPPYNSKWPKRIPSLAYLEKKYGIKKFYKSSNGKRGYVDIWSSMIYPSGGIADFGNYVVNSEVSHWTSRPLSSGNKNKKLIYENFKKDLNSNQLELLAYGTNPYHGVGWSNIDVELSYKTDSELEEIIKGSDSDLQTYEEDQTKIKLQQFKDSLSKKKLNFFNEEIEPFLNSHGEIEDPLKDFDFNLAQRWAFNKVVQLGWNEKQHGEFDFNLNRSQYERTEQKAERIGKKYQWIALYELLARIADNFEFKEEPHSNVISAYQGTWQLGVRNIDPTTILKDNNIIGMNDTPIINKHLKENSYNAWIKNISNTEWLKRTKDLPDPKKIIEFEDENSNKWLMLDGFVEWQDETPPEFKKYDIPTRRMWYMFNSYLVKNDNNDKFFSWAKKQNYMGRWMPESNSFYNVFLGEYPWSPAFSYINNPYHGRDEWVDGGRRNSKLPSKILVSNDHYLSSGSDIDCSTENSINIKLPHKLLVNEMKLTQNNTDGRFYNKVGNLIAFDPSVFNKKMPSCLLINKNEFTKFLKKSNYSVVWTFLAEKQIIGTHGSFEGRLESSGAYTLGDDDVLKGRKHNTFKPPHN